MALKNLLVYKCDPTVTRTVHPLGTGRYIAALGSNTGMGFRLTNDFVVIYNGETFVWILDLYKNSGCFHYAN